MPATTLDAWIGSDLRDAARIITVRGLHADPDTLALRQDGGPVGPVAAAWLVARSGRLPYVFVTPIAGALEVAAEQLAEEPRAVAVVEFLARHVNSGLPPQKPIARVADWASRKSQAEVVELMADLADWLNPNAA